MKHFFFICLTGLTSVANAQEFTKQFFEAEFEQYHGAQFIIDDENITGWTNAFYLDFEASLSLSSDVSFQSTEYSFKTDPSKMPPGPYQVIEILDRNDNFKIRSSEARFKLMASDGTEFWFRYDSKFEHKFPFLVSEIDIDETTVCAKISTKTDDFTGEKTYRTPFLKDAQMTKIVKEGSATSYLTLHAQGLTLNVAEKGVIILLEDGSKLEFPGAEIDAKSGEGANWDYSAFIPLNAEALTQLSMVPIDKWRLYIYDVDFDSREAETLRIQIKCLMDMN